MTKRRVRLNDENDPLSSTDKVLASFEQVSKSSSQKYDNSASQQYDVLTSQPDNYITSQPEATLHQTPLGSFSNTLCEDIKSQEVNQQNFKQGNMLTSQQDNNPTLKQAGLPTSQQVKNEKPKLRKSTFQISDAVLHQLDQLHLTLQLEMGKANAPYKEVIVEEALVRLLKEVNSDRMALIEALLSRHKSRDNI
jgi:hypothetical protein